MSDSPQQEQATGNVNVLQSQVGVIGDQARVEGGIHFHAQPAPIPLQRPARAEHFTDRKPELAQLLADLQPGRVVTLCGPGGIGKSALAAEAVWTLAPGDQLPGIFPGGIIFHNFYKQSQVTLALEHIARSYGDRDPRPTPAAAAQRALAGRQALLILDGTEQADDLLELLAIVGHCGVLVTSRRRQDAAATRQDISSLQTWPGRGSPASLGRRSGCKSGRSPTGVRPGRLSTVSCETDRTLSGRPGGRSNRIPNLAGKHAACRPKLWPASAGKRHLATGAKPGPGQRGGAAGSGRGRASSSGDFQPGTDRNSARCAPGRGRPAPGRAGRLQPDPPGRAAVSGQPRFGAYLRSATTRAIDRTVRTGGGLLYRAGRGTKRPGS